jgi:mRNA interferase MazF
MQVAYVPDRNDIVWLDFEPTKGKEIGKYRPAFVLSSRAYNQQTGLLICFPISSSIRGSSTEVLVNNLEKPSVVASGLIQTLAWRECKAKFIEKAENGVIQKVLQCVLPLIGIEELL